MVVDDTLSMRIYSFIDNILINKTIKEIKQKIDFIVFCVRHLGLIVTAVTINGFTPVLIKHVIECQLKKKYWTEIWHCIYQILEPRFVIIILTF